MFQVNLDREALINAGAEPSLEAKGSGYKNYLTLNGIKLEVYESGTVTLYPGDLLAAVDKSLLPFVHECSFYENFGYGLQPKRQLGHYRLGNAVAELEIVGGGRGDYHYHVRVRAKTIEDLRELYRLIREGQIWPAIDYETKQVPPPCLHLRDLVSEIGRVIRRDIRGRLYRIREQVLGAY